MARKVNTIEHILSRSIRDRETGCLIYTGAVNEKGYPMISYKGKMVRGSRWVYKQYYGTIPAGHDIDHTCYVRRCLELTHLRPLTHRMNITHSRIYDEKRIKRLKQLIETYPQIKLFPILITLPDLKDLWDCKSTAHVKALLRTMSKALPEEFFYERLKEGQGRNPDLYAIGIHPSLIDKLPNEDTLRETPAEDIMTLMV
jgi:HNH endonuclease